MKSNDFEKPSEFDLSPQAEERDLSANGNPGRLPSVETALELDSIDVTLGGNPVLVGVDVSLGKGNSLAVVGPNGSGKTTLLRLMATLLRPTRGTGHVLGADLSGTRVSVIRPQIGLISHTPALIDELTLEENLRHFANLSGKRFESCLKALEVVGMEKAGDRRAGESSFGMRRRIEIAWQLVNKPRLLLLDEARTGLDNEAQELIGALISVTLANSGTVVGVSHEQSQLGDDFSSVRTLVSGKLEGAP